MVSRRLAFASALWLVLLPGAAWAVSNGPLGQGEPQNGLPPGAVYNPQFALAPGFAPAIDNLSTANPAWVYAPVAYRSWAATVPLVEGSSSLAFDIGSYDAMWQDAEFSEIAAYGGLDRDVERVAVMKAV